MKYSSYSVLHFLNVRWMICRTVRLLQHRFPAQPSEEAVPRSLTVW